MKCKFVYLSTDVSIHYHVFQGDRCVVSGFYDPRKKIEVFLFESIRDAFADDGYEIIGIEV